MNKQPMWMIGSPNPVSTEIAFLRSRLTEARRLGDKGLEALVLENLKAFRRMSLRNVR